MDFNDYPTEKSIPWKPIALAVAGLLVVVVIIVVVLRVLDNRDNDVFTAFVASQVEFSLENCEGEEDQAGCETGVINDMATQHGSDETCELHDEDADRDNCYWLLAQETENTMYCGEITEDENRILCADGINAKLARQSNQNEYCQRIMDEGRKEQCIDFLASEELKNDCLNGSERAECDEYRTTQQAVKSLSQDLCAAIEDEAARASCQDAVASSGIDVVIATGDIDSDNDGLSDEQEAEYGTDPNNPDTDGDGYPDGDEVSSGYNPLGEGTLE